MAVNRGSKAARLWTILTAQRASWLSYRAMAALALHLLKTEADAVLSCTVLTAECMYNVSLIIAAVRFYRC
jgi:hypothetical protein